MVGTGSKIANKVEIACKEFHNWRQMYIQKHGRNEYGKEKEKAEEIQIKYGFKSDLIIKIFFLDRKPELDEKYNKGKGINL